MGKSKTAVSISSRLLAVGLLYTMTAGNGGAQCSNWGMGGDDNKKASGGGASSVSSPANSNNTPPPPPAMVVTVSMKRLGTDSGSPENPHRIHEDGVGGSTECRLQPDEDNPKNMTCIVEALEENLFQRGMDLTVNIPPRTCKFLHRRDPWYWKQEVGAGPTAVTVRLDSQGKKSIVDYTMDRVYTVAAGSRYPANAAEDEIVRIDQTTGALVCKFDQSRVSGVGRNGLNCCYGKYKITTIAADGSQSRLEDQKWGDPSTCIRGPAQDHNPKDAANFPVTKVIQAEDGIANLVESYIPPVQKDLGLPANLYLANYFKGDFGSTTSRPSMYQAPIDEFGLQTNLIAIDPNGIEDQYGLPWTAYDFDCMNDATESLGRIRVRVREWNTSGEFKKGNPHAPPIAGDPNPDKTGYEVNGHPNNDYRDVDDFEAISSPPRMSRFPYFWVN